jgi:hypothetical protein
VSITIGIDFDNTIVSYDDLMYRAAVDHGLIGDGAEAVAKTKRAVRDRVRMLPGGEIAWQELQALVYGPLMSQARATDGAEDFIRWCREAGFAVRIVSHKTEYANYDRTRTNLRTAALDWMAARRFFDRDGLNLGTDDVFFESTRAGKIARIAAIGCSHFIDDLEEVFLEPAFPPSVHRILYAPGPSIVSTASARVMRSWEDVREYFFDHRA